MTDVVIEAEVSGPELGHLPAQSMRAKGATREQCIHNIKRRAVKQDAIFGATDKSEIEIKSAEVIA